MGAGSMNFTIKSGGLKYHGQVSGFLRNTVFAAWSFSQKASTIKNSAGQNVQAPKSPEHPSEISASIGGYVPHAAHKVFFFFAYDRYHSRFGQNPSLTTIPSTLMMNGDFTEFNGSPGTGLTGTTGNTAFLFDPTTNNCVGTVCTRQPFQGVKNGIPTNQRDPGRRHLANHAEDGIVHAQLQQRDSRQLQQLCRFRQLPQHRHRRTRQPSLRLSRRHRPDCEEPDLSGRGDGPVCVCEQLQRAVSSSTLYNWRLRHHRSQAIRHRGCLYHHAASDQSVQVGLHALLHAHHQRQRHRAWLREHLADDWRIRRHQSAGRPDQHRVSGRHVRQPRKLLLPAQANGGPTAISIPPNSPFRTTTLWSTTCSG